MLMMEAFSSNSLIHIFSCSTLKLKLFPADKTIFELLLPLLHSQSQGEFSGYHSNLHNDISYMDTRFPSLKLKLISVCSGSPELKVLQ